ncbi:hypothetical protein ACKRZS_003408 [Fusarium odoratissimum]|nr:uncharacterized protein FOIG_04643 [Fusarium odoratissimum NRRL 54006]EXM04427.1 hypothetical protein FOIG_04643 [Fusarium odoratissimum NRRL 54006]KAK2126518.1 hypothetical protein NOF04DRAFT_18386 [Fusarium oxysporum II5]TXB98143.1 hypothetical protein FocTR4_00012362 [Fusarium oxysporum f. sp. cubense]
MIAPNRLVAASLMLVFGQTNAGPCRPSSNSIVLSSNVGIHESSTLTKAQSATSGASLSDASTISHIYTETTSDATAMSLSTSITISLESTTTTFSTATESQDTIVDTTSGATKETQSTSEAPSTEAATPTTEQTTTTVLGRTTETTTEAATTLAQEITTTTAESTTEPLASSIETTTITTAALAAPTFNLIAQGGLSDGVVLHSNGQYFQIRTSQYTTPYPATFPEAALSYDQATQHLLINGVPLCVYYDTQGIIGGLYACQGVPTGQYGYLTCDPPSNGGLACNVPGLQYDQPSSSLIDLGQTWSQFYYLEQMTGLGTLLIGRAGLTKNEIKYNRFDPINILVREV